MTKAWNSTLEQRTPLKANKGLERHKGLNPISDKQRAKNELWNEITEERCLELGYICLWCGQPGQRNDPTRWDYLDGHHSKKPRYLHNTKKYCYLAHRAPCHGEIEDNNINVLEYSDRGSWIRRRSR